MRVNYYRENWKYSPSVTVESNFVPGFMLFYNFVKYDSLTSITEIKSVCQFFGYTFCYLEHTVIILITGVSILTLSCLPITN